MDDLYSDLPEDIPSHHVTKLENEVQILQFRIRELEELIENREADVGNFRQQLDFVQRENTILRANISSLYRTAKAEIDRKNQQLQESRKSTCQPSVDKEHSVKDLANLNKVDRNLDEMSNAMNSYVGQKICETIDENYEDIELSGVRRTLKGLIDEILHKNDLRCRSDSTGDPYEKFNDRDSLLLRANDDVLQNESRGDDVGLSEISSNAFSDDELEVRSKKQKKKKKLSPKKKKKLSPKKRK